MLSPCASEAGLSLPLALWVTSEGADQYQLPQTWEEGAAETSLHLLLTSYYRSSEMLGKGGGVDLGGVPALSLLTV